MGSLVKNYRRWRFLFLLLILLFVLVVQPILFGFAPTSLSFDAFFALLLMTAVISLAVDRRARVFAMLVGIPTILFELGGHALPNTPGTGVVMFDHVCSIIFLLSSSTIIVKNLVLDRQVTLDSIFGAVCGYLLLGVSWGVLYSMLAVHTPGSFAINDRLREAITDGEAGTNVFLYYSFVTLTTVGYGDVTPVSVASRTCAWLEALTGQFYLAVVVAGLVGALITRPVNERGKGY